MRTDIRKIYIFAGVLSFILYFSGIFTGLYLQSASIGYTEQRMDSLRKRMENVQLEYMYLNAVETESSCNFLSILLDDASKEVYEIGKQLTEYQESNQNPAKSSELAAEYSLISVRAWVLNNYLNMRCNENKTTILYFYSVPCEGCREQGIVLDEIWQKYGGRIKIFVLNANSEETMVQLLAKTYNITSTPAMLIHEKTYYGVLGIDALDELVS